MRKFLVRNFIAYYNYKSTILREISEWFGVCFIAVLVLTGFSYPYILGILGGLGILLYLLPGKKVFFSTERAGRNGFISFSILFLTYTKFYPYDEMLWYHWGLIMLMVLTAWIIFSGYKFGYFDLFPPKREELSEEQIKAIDSRDK